MKHFNNILITIGVLLSCCDTIPENGRTEKADEIVVRRSVLLEDFTGQLCINCPRAASRAEAIQEALHGKLVIVSIHAGIFSTAEFRTEAGDEYRKYFYPADDGYPAGMIDRTAFNDNVINTNDAGWGNYILERAQKEHFTNSEIYVQAVFNLQDSLLNVNVTGKIPEINNSNLYLQLWLTESHFIAPQKTVGTTIRDYEHNHILRDAINGIWGEPLTVNDDYSFDIQYNNYKIPLKGYHTDNLSVVGFVYRFDNNDRRTREVVSVAESGF